MPSKKKLILGLILLVGALFIATVGLRTITSQAGVVAKEVRSHVGGPAVDRPTFVRLGRFIVPIMAQRDVAAHISVTVSLELTSPAHVGAVNAARRELRDAFFRDLSAAAYWPDIRSGNHLPPRAMKQRLRAVSDRVLGPGVVREVLVANMLERRF